MLATIVATYRSPVLRELSTGASLKRAARNLRRASHGRLDWREEELFELLLGCASWDHARVIIRLHQTGII